MLQSGIIDVELLQIDFMIYVAFIGNKASAIYSYSAQLNVFEGTHINFINNTATKGGALSLHGFSVLNLYPGSQVIFDSNYASELRGAVYVTLPHQVHFFSPHSCFISYGDSPLSNPREWNASIVITNNSADYGRFLFTDSILPCLEEIGLILTSSSELVQWQTFIQQHNMDKYTIATSPAVINFTLPAVSPGEVIRINPISLDDLNQFIQSSLEVIFDSDNNRAKTNDFTSDNGIIQIFGNPGTHFNLTLRTLNTRQVSVTKSGILGNCPLGSLWSTVPCVSVLLAYLIEHWLESQCVILLTIKPRFRLVIG